MAFEYFTTITILNPTESLVAKFQELESIQDKNQGCLFTKDIKPDCVEDVADYWFATDISYNSFNGGSVTYTINGRKGAETEGDIALSEIIDELHPINGRYEIVETWDDYDWTKTVSLKSGQHDGSFFTHLKERAESIKDKYMSIGNKLANHGYFV